MAVEYAKNIRIDGAANAYPDGQSGYEMRVSLVLQNLNATRTGSTLIGFFALRRRTLTIQPREDRCEASAVQTVVLDSERDFDNTFRRGSPVRTFEGAPVPGRTGQGGGHPAVILFDTIHWTYPERVLIHELFHGLRVIFGFQERLPMGATWGNSEELYCIFIENMYAEERGLEMRTGHSGSPTIQGTPAHSMASNREFHTPMRHLSQMMPFIVQRLSQVPTGYNPFRDWLSFSRR
jgi:hypothetical protein